MKATGRASDSGVTSKVSEVFSLGFSWVIAIAGLLRFYEDACFYYRKWVIHGYS